MRSRTLPCLVAVIAFTIAPVSAETADGSSPHPWLACASADECRLEVDFPCRFPVPISAGSVTAFRRFRAAFAAGAPQSASCPISADALLTAWREARRSLTCENGRCTAPTRSLNLEPFSGVLPTKFPEQAQNRAASGDGHQAMNTSTAAEPRAALESPPGQQPQQASEQPRRSAATQSGGAPTEKPDINLIVSALTQPNDDAKIRALDTIERLKLTDAKLREPLKQIATSPVPSLRVRAFRWLANNGPPDDALKIATQHFRVIRSVSAPDEDREVLAFLRAQARRAGAAFEPILQTLRQRLWDRSTSAPASLEPGEWLDTLVAIDRARAEAELVKMLAAPNEALSCAAATELAKYQDTSGRNSDQLIEQALATRARRVETGAPDVRRREGERMVVTLDNDTPNGCFVTALSEYPDENRILQKLVSVVRDRPERARRGIRTLFLLAREHRVPGAAESIASIADDPSMSPSSRSFAESLASEAAGTRAPVERR